MPKDSKDKNQSKNYGINDRQQRQDGEGYDTKKNDLPGYRFQDTQQTPNSEDLGVDSKDLSNPDGTKANNDAAAMKELKAKMRIRPEASVEQLEGKQIGGIPLSGRMNTRDVAGTRESAVEDTSRIPYVKGGNRPDTRYGKKVSYDLNQLDEQICEQIAPNVEDAKDLKDAPDALQGYNGRHQFKSTRGKKNFKYTNDDGNTIQKLPQQLLNDASVDYIHTSKLLYTCGQMITGDNVTEGYSTPTGGDYPLIRDDNSAVPFEMHKSNYVLKNLKILNGRDHIIGISFEEDEHLVCPDPVTRDQANMNLQLDINNVTHSMIKLQDELGRETGEYWSPLGYVAKEGYEYNTLMHDIEASAAAMQAIAYRAGVSADAYQRNICGKDGVNPQANAVKMIVEGYVGPFANSEPTTINDTDVLSIVFNKGEYRKGSIAALIEMFDTPKKYKTKGDILGMDKSISQWLAKADNNLAPLHCKETFIKALDKVHMYSTPTGEYNPMLPIMSTRTVRIVNPLSLNVFARNWKNPKLFDNDDRNDRFRDKDTGTYANYSYGYRDLRNNSYVNRVQHPIVDGLIKWLLKHEGTWMATYGRAEDDAHPIEITIPCTFNFEAPSMFEFLLCAASQDILYERNICFRDVLFAEKQEEQYVWNDLKSLKDLDPLYSTQLKIRGYKESLGLGKLSNDTIVREFWNDQIQLTETKSGKAQYFLPWYCNERAIKGTYDNDTGFFDDLMAENMTIPSIRDGVRHEYVDCIKSMEDRDIRLSLDRRIDIPVFINVENVNDSDNNKMWTRYYNRNDASKLNQKIKFGALRYDPNSDGRLVVVYDLTAGTNMDFTFNSLYCCAKELGYIDDDYYPFKVVTAMSLNGSTLTVTSTEMTSETTVSGRKAYNGASPMFLTSYRVYGDSNTRDAIDRAAALSQVFYNCFANIAANIATINTKFVDKTGIIPCLGYNAGAPTDVVGIYDVKTDTESTIAIDKTMRTLADRVWCMLQRFFLPINRFENMFTVSQKVDYDPLEHAFYFGLCGTLASDFTQDVNNRLLLKEELGMDYTEDEFIKASPIFRLVK